MIIDYDQKQDLIDISYVTDDGRIDIESVNLPNGYYKYVTCDEFDPDKIPNLKSFKGQYLKREPASSFTNHNINEYFNRGLKEEHPELFDKMMKMNIPFPFSVDIETEINDEFGYSSSEDAENKVLSISITDYNLNSILFVLKNPNHPEITTSDHTNIDLVLREALGDYYTRYEYRHEIRVFETEYEMINTFFQCVNKYFHSLFGWNYVQYDYLYLFNRAKKIGIDPKKMSPKNIIYKAKLKVSPTLTVEYFAPKHRIITDYMVLFKRSQKFNNWESYSLNYASEKILNLHKVSYEGNLRKLYETNYPRFLGYAFVDTILVMLLHRATNLYGTNFFHSFYTSVPVNKLTQTSISEALVYNELRKDNIFLAESEFNKEDKREYIGGYVKNPTMKFVNCVMGEDFHSLYPSTIKTIGLSPERKIDHIVVNENGFPANPIEESRWQKYKAKGCCLSPMGRVYDNNGDGLYVRIESNLGKERKLYQGYQQDIYLNVIPQIENELKRRGIK